MVSWEEYDRCIQTAEEESAAGAQWYGQYCERLKPEVTTQVMRVGGFTVRDRRPQALINGEWVDVNDIRVTYVKMADSNPVVVNLVIPRNESS